MIAQGEQAHVVERTERTRAPFQAVTHALIRVNNVPFVALRANSSVDTMAMLGRLAGLRRWMHEHRQPLCDLLFQVIARDPGSRAMRPLLDLKRDIHGDRDTKVPAEVALALCDDNTLRAWYQTRAEAAALLAQVEASHAERLREERMLVQELLVHPDFLRATAVSSLDLQEAIDGYVKTAVDAHGKRQRKSEQALLSYLLRAMTRTSPYSYYTSVAYACWDVAGAPPPPWPLASERVRLVEPNHVVFRRLVEAVVTHPELREQLQYRVCQDAKVVQGAITFSVFRDDPVNQPRAFRVRQFLGRVPATPALIAVLQLLRKLGPTAYPKMVAEIASSLRSAGEAGVRPIIDRLIAAGLVVPVIPIGENSPDIVADAATFLRTLPAPLSQQMAGTLEEVGTLLRTLPGDDPPARRSSLKALQAAAIRAHTLVGMPAPQGTPIVYEDTGISGTMRGDPALWQDVRQDLAALGDFIELFDTNTVLPALVRDAFVERYGQGGRCAYLDFTDATFAIYERWFQISVSNQLPPELGERHPGLRTKFELRREVSRQITGQWRGEEEIVIGRDVLDAVAAAMPTRSGLAWASYGIFVQPEVEAGEIRRVFVNPVYQGLGMFFSRFLPMLGEEAAGTVRDNIRSFFPKDWLVAGVRPVAGFNANLHPPMTPHELDLELDGEPAGDVKLTDLALMHDPETDAVVLMHGQTGQRVAVLYHGFLIPALLPPKWSLVQALASGNVYGSALLWESKEKRPDRPRVSYGKVVFSRRTWSYPVASVPRPGPAETEAQYFARINLWRIQHGVPPEAFVKAPSAETAPPKSGEWWTQLGWTREKPQYIDFESAVVVRFFAKWLERRREDGQLTFTETRPALPQSLFRSAGGPHATELLIEINRPPRSSRPPGGHP